MDKKLRSILQGVVIAGRDFLKASNQVMDREFGAAVQKEASAATDAMIEAGFADPTKKMAIIGELIYNKSAAYDGLRKLSERAAVIPLGTPDNTKSAEVPATTASELWDSRWGF